MADRDEALHYLLNKLKSDDGWSGSNLSWNEDKLAIIADKFNSFDGVAKVKVLLSFIGMTPRTITQCSNEMLQILRLARRDGDEWVRLFASVLAPFPNDQTINSDQITEGTLEDLQEKITEALSQRKDQLLFVPHEYSYLNSSVLSSTHNFYPPLHHQHFILKSQPQASIQLRNDMVQRAGVDFSQTGSLIKDRHLLQRQLSSTTGTGSTAFVPTVRLPSSRKSVPIPGMSSKVNRERGTKLLDIDEVPVKRKRKLVAEEATPTQGRPETKKHPRLPSKGEVTTPLSPPVTEAPPTPLVTTPDYAAGLGSEYEPATPAYALKSPDIDSHPPPPPPPQPLPVGTGQPAKKEAPPPPVIPPLTPTFTPGIDKPAELPLFRNPLPPITPTTPLAPPTPTPTGETSTATPPSTKQPTKGLKLSRQQLSIAQEMFKESPTLTREQKALILGFMAGSRDNPNPSQNITTIKLNSRQEVEEVKLPSKDGSIVKAKRNTLIETVFEMNYENGQWRKLQLKRTFPLTAAQ